MLVKGARVVFCVNAAFAAAALALDELVGRDTEEPKDDVEPGLRKFGILDFGRGSFDEGRGSPDGLAS